MAAQKPTTSPAPAPAQSIPAPAVRTRPFRLKEGAKMSTKVRGEDGVLIVHGAGTIVHLTEQQAKAFGDRIEPVAG
jgi:hypothetical protein